MVFFQAVRVPFKINFAIIIYNNDLIYDNYLWVLIPLCIIHYYHFRSFGCSYPRYKRGQEIILKHFFSVYYCTVINPFRVDSLGRVQGK